MARHVILGKGPIGRTVATQLLEAGHDVVVLSRSGGAPGPAHPRLTAGALDGADADALTAATRGADALYNCVNPPYHRWPTDWPPVAEALLLAAERTGAVLVTAGNLYSYGAGTRLMTETTPFRTTETKGLVRAAMSTEALARHAAGRLRSTEVRGSDYLGPGAEAHAHAGPRLLDPLLRGRTIRPIGGADAPHSWTYLPDFARALVAAATTEAAWGRAWHVPSPEPLTLRDVARRFAAAAGAPEPRISPLPMAVVRALGLVQPQMRELAAMGYQFTEPFVMDSTASQAALGLAPTPWPQIVEETLAAHRAPGAVARAA